MKKLLSIILAAALMIGVMPAAFAETCAEGEHDYHWVSNLIYCELKCSKCGKRDYGVQTHATKWVRDPNAAEDECKVICNVEGCDNHKAYSEHKQASYEPWRAGKEENTCAKVCGNCSAVMETHDTIWTEWKAPTQEGNGIVGSCLRTCTVEGCTRREIHRTEYIWAHPEVNHDDYICGTCNTTWTCPHATFNYWTLNGDNCERQCSSCIYKESHTTQWDENYTKPTTGNDSCTGRYCRAEGCTNVDQIDTLEELQEAIAQGVKEIQTSYYHNKQQFLHEAGPITINKNAAIDGGEGGVTFQRLGTGGNIKPAFIIKDGAELTLKNFTIEGKGNFEGAAIIIEDGTLILDDGAALKNNSVGTNSAESKGVIHIKNGNLIINEGSKLTGNKGAYSSLIELRNGTVTMNGGEISGNTCGIIMISGSNATDAQFIMNGGKIVNNPLGNYSDGVVYVGNGSFVMNDGEISGNTNSGYAALGSGVISGTAFGVMGLGEKADTSITINGGVIKDNKAHEGSWDTGDLLIGYSNVKITGGEFGTVLGNDYVYDIFSKNIEANFGMTYEELLEYIDNNCPEEKDAILEEFGLTKEVLANETVITGGIFESDVSAHVPETATEISYTAGEGAVTKYAVGARSVSVLLKDAGEGDTVTVVTGNSVTGVPNGVTVSNRTGGNITVNGNNVAEGDTIVIGAPSESIAWKADTDAGYYMVSGTKYGIMRFLFAADVADADIEEVGIKYSKADDIAETVSGTYVSKPEALKAFYGDVIGIPQTENSNIYAAAYVRIDGEYKWSAPQSCSANWGRYFGEYAPASVGDEQ